MLWKDCSGSFMENQHEGVLSRVITRESRLEAAEVMKAWVWMVARIGMEQWRW